MIDNWGQLNLTWPGNPIKDEKTTIVTVPTQLQHKLSVVVDNDDDNFRVT